MMLPLPDNQWLFLPDGPPPSGKDVLLALLIAGCVVVVIWFVIFGGQP